MINLSTQFYISQQVKSYDNALNAWVRRVCSDQNIESSARLATHMPYPSSIVSASTPRSNQVNAKLKIENHLKTLVEKCDNAALLRRVQSLFQGHYPKLYQMTAQKLASL